MDIKLIAALRSNARASITELSNITKIPISTVYEHLKKYKGSVIKKYTTIVDFAKFGYQTTAYVIIKVHPDDKKKCQEYIMKCRHANAVYKINNNFDFMVEFVFQNMKELEEQIERIELETRVLDKKTFYIIEDLKKEAFLSNPQALKWDGLEN